MRPALFLILSLCVIATPSPAMIGPGMAPDINLPQGTQLSAKKGQVVLLSFWEHWCEPCKKEMPALERLWKTFGRKGLFVVGVSTDVTDNVPKAQAVVAQKRLTYPILYDEAQRVKELYAIEMFPSTFLIDKRGYIRDTLLGLKDETYLIARVEDLLAERKAPPRLFFSGLEYKGKTVGLKSEADAAVRSELAKSGRIRFSPPEGGPPEMAEYCLLGNVLQIGQAVGIDLSLKKNGSSESFPPVAETCGPEEVGLKLPKMVQRVLLNVK